MAASNIIELTELRDTTRVFQDRADAGQRLVGMLEADSERQTQQTQGQTSTSHLQTQGQTSTSH